MNSQFGFQPDRKITDVFKEKKFTISAEIIPPRNGTEQNRLLSEIQRLTQSGSHFLAVTKGAGGSLRGGSLPIAQVIKEQFKVPCIAHFTCRDLVPQEVENQLMDHHYFGIRNILALRGDPPNDQPNWQPKAGSYTYAFQLIEQISNLNQGKYLLRPLQQGSIEQQATNFCIGAAVYPEHPDQREQTSFFERKIRAGANFAITQMIFDIEIFKRFQDQCNKFKLNIPILPGTRLLKSRKQAENIAKKFSVSIPQKTYSRLPEAIVPGSAPRLIEIFLEFVEELKKIGAPGIHLFVLSDCDITCQSIQRIVTLS